MRRRQFILHAIFTVCPVSMRALGQQQPPRKVSRVGYLGTGGPTRMVLDFRQGLRDLGWVEGQNLVIEYRFAEGQLERLPGMRTAKCS